MDEVCSAIKRVDHPGGFVAHSEVLDAGLLANEGVCGELGLEAGDDQILAGLVCTTAT